MSTKQVIIVRHDLGMSKGKLAAQVAHASMAFLTAALKTTEEDEGARAAIYIPYVYKELKLEMVEQEWLDNSFTKVVLWVEDEAEYHELCSRANQAGLKVHKIQDNGRTEFNGVLTWTAAAIGPDECEFIDKVTGHLRLVR